MARILMVLTSHDRLGDTGKPTGFWLEEFAAPYYVLRDAGVDVTLATPKGGQPPVDPKSDEPGSETPAMKRFRSDLEAQRALANTVKLSSVSADDYDAVFYPGGHGPLWDLAEDRDSIALIERLYAAGKPVAAVCHGPAVLRRAKGPDGAPLVKGKTVTGFTNTEEAAVELTKVVPFLVEDALKANGGRYSRAEDWASHAVVDGNLITGQNPASSEATAKALLEALGSKVGGARKPEGAAR
jgi:putative cofactor-binding repeat protein